MQSACDEAMHAFESRIMRSSGVRFICKEQFAFIVATRQSAILSIPLHMYHMSVSFMPLVATDLHMGSSRPETQRP